MAKILQQNLFSWKEIEDLGDLERLHLVINHLDDEALIQLLERDRKNGRDDYPVRAIWNSMLAGIVYQHPTIETLIRELKRNAQLREICGFDPLKGRDAIPKSYNYSRFLKKLLNNTSAIDKIFNSLVRSLQNELPGFGKILAGDGKAISSHANTYTKKPEADGRRDLDADFGKKTYQGINEDGSAWKKVKSWFGYKLHLIIDAEYEIPVGFEVTKASCAETKVMKKLLDKVDTDQPDFFKTCEYLLLDRGYDDNRLAKKLWKQYGVKPIIDIRNLWKDPDKTRLLEGTQNIVYDYRGKISCCSLASGNMQEMSYGGYEKNRETLKYRCPAKAYGLSCSSSNTCPSSSGLRIKIDENIRQFPPLPRSTYKWKDLYKKRTTVERVNGRLDVSFGFENHTIRGLKKMKVRCGLALIVMLTMALGRAREKKFDLIRSLVKTA